jgi:bifunctional non-homologous end joining protein LigD
LRRVRIQEKTKTGEYLVADSSEAVVSLAQMGIVEIHLRNNRTNTSVSAFSPRARPGAMVSMPLDWEDLNESPERWTLQTVPRRLARLRADPWNRYWNSAMDLSSASITAIDRLS